MAGLRPRQRPGHPEVREALAAALAARVARWSADRDRPDGGHYAPPWPRLLAALAAGEPVTVPAPLLAEFLARPLPSGCFHVDQEGRITRV